MASSSSASPSNQKVHLLMKDAEDSKNWAELPPELTCSILFRLNTFEILKNAQRVCRSWRHVCKGPSMWRKIDLRNRGIFDYDCDSLSRLAVDRSHGGLVEVNIGNFGTDSLLNYIAERSNYLRCLRLTMCYPLTSKGFVNAVMKLPFLEDLEVSHCYSQLNLKAIGRSCPLLKTFKLNRTCFSSDIESDREALAIAETMSELLYLELIGNKLTNTGLNAILDNCLHLEHLDLRRCFNIYLVGDLEKRCSERIRDFIRPDDSTDDYSFDATFSYTDTEEEDDNYSYGSDDIEYVYNFSDYV